MDYSLPMEQCNAATSKKKNWYTYTIAINMLLLINLRNLLPNYFIDTTSKAKDSNGICKGKRNMTIFSTSIC
jgi:hypothetical protein